MSFEILFNSYMNVYNDALAIGLLIGILLSWSIMCFIVAFMESKEKMKLYTFLVKNKLAQKFEEEHHKESD